jgi:hypothetical protein
MKKRLRKKKYLGEFKVFGVSVAISFARDDDLALQSAFLLEAVEANGCLFGGGGPQGGLVGFIELGQAHEQPQERLEKIRAWLSSQEAVRAFSFGPMTDACYGPFSSPNLSA